MTTADLAEQIVFGIADEAPPDLFEQVFDLAPGTCKRIDHLLKDGETRVSFLRTAAALALAQKERLQ